MKKGLVFALSMAAVTALLVVIGTLHPVSSAAAYAGGDTITQGPTSGPEAAINELGRQISQKAWDKAYSSLSNKGEFTQPEFVHDLTGYGLSLRTYATLDHFEAEPLHQSASDAEYKVKLHWSSVVGIIDDTRDLHVAKVGDHWAVTWPLVKETHVPPQVIPVNYLRWDVIYRGAGDDWGTQDVDAPHVRVVDMHPLNRADGVVVMGEMLNEDVMPAFVSVKATLIGKDGKPLASEGSFDMILHTLLPKQVTPFIIHFPDIDISQVGSIQLDPVSILVSASADPIVEVQNQKFDPGPNAALTGQLSNQSGHVVNIAHVLSTFYDKNGQVMWVAGQYIDRTLEPQTPVDFRVTVPEDLAKKISSERTVVATFMPGSTL